ncbi:MAG: fasciclin domain-containing protein, partial [Woeseia sp.]
MKTIIETAKEAGTFNTLIAAVKAADLTDTLNGKGPFTVFAPTDEAFKKISKTDLDALLKDKAALKSI